jgi:lysozyme
MHIDYDRLRKMLTLEEGVRLKPYRDTKGKLTIGVGRNIDDVGLRPVEAEFLLSNDIGERIEQLPKALPWIATLDSVRQTVMVDLAFMGINRLLTFSRMLAALRDGAWELAADELLDSKWAREDVQSSRAQRLALMLRTGAWPPDVA